MISGCPAYAHRGLWSADGLPENSIGAFRAAADAGLGIELDVQMSKDGVPFVFHDPALDRMSNGKGLVWQHTSDELAALRLAGTTEPLPWLSHIDKALPAGTPVLVELKVAPGNKAEYIRAVGLALYGCRINAAIMSFDLELCALAHAHMPGRQIGALVNARARLEDEKWDRKLDEVRALAPDFVAHWHEDVDSIAAAFPGPRAAWTVTSEAALDACIRAGTAPIFEDMSAGHVLGAIAR